MEEKVIYKPGEAKKKDMPKPNKTGKSKSCGAPKKCGKSKENVASKNELTNYMAKPSIEEQVEELGLK